MHPEDSKASLLLLLLLTEDRNASLVHCVNGKRYEDEVNLLFSISVGLVTKTAPLVWGVKEPTNCLKTVRVVVLVVAMHHSFSIHSFFFFFVHLVFSLHIPVIHSISIIVYIKRMENGEGHNMDG